MKLTIEVDPKTLAVLRKEMQENKVPTLEMHLPAVLAKHAAQTKSYWKFRKTTFTLARRCSGCGKVCVGHYVFKNGLPCGPRRAARKCPRCNKPLTAKTDPGLVHLPEVLRPLEAATA